MSFKIILACSGKKNGIDECRAEDLYIGEIFKKGQAIAIKHQVRYWILSAKYGIIMPEDVIETYNQKLTKPYKGPFPPDMYYGFYVGGQSYFKNFPEQWLPLVPPAPIGKMLQSLKVLVDDPDAALARLMEHPKNAAL